MTNQCPSSIYGPVRSWRLGKSLGVDVLCVDSICSFECVYCQLGKINRVTRERGIFVTTEKVVSDLKASDWPSADVITFSGSGEPTLAANLGEIIARLKSITGKPIIVLTNSTLLCDPQVRGDLALADQVFCKLDAWSDEVLRRLDRPAPGISLQSILAGIRLLRQDFSGFLAIQAMILRLPTNEETAAFAGILSSLGADEVQLNLPTRPIPHAYFVETRGNEVEPDPTFTRLRTVSKNDLAALRGKLAELTGLPVISR
jgi:wyosine [tRNA(Phe)-imidazoG37] synthetase (radical SAM superfamily)